MGSLRREVMVPVPSYRRPSSLIGISVVLVLLASAVDAVVWTYQAKRDAARSAAQDSMGVPTLSHTDVAAVRARVLEADMARAQQELREIDQRVLERLRNLNDEHAVLDEDRQIREARGQTGPAELEDPVVTIEQCDPSDPLCGIE